MFCDCNPDDAILFDVNQNGNGFHLSRNFTLSEARSGCGDRWVWIHPATIVLAQKLRDEFGPLEVRSWYRSKQHNKNIGGVDNSRHVLGMAVDLAPLETDVNKFKKRILQMDIGGIGIYDSFVHVDVYSNNRRWNHEST